MVLFSYDVKSSSVVRNIFRIWDSFKRQEKIQLYLLKEAYFFGIFDVI